MRTSLTNGRANHGCQQAPAINQDQRSAAAAFRGRTVVQPRVCLKKRKACSTVKRRKYQRRSEYLTAAAQASLGLGASIRYGCGHAGQQRHPYTCAAGQVGCQWSSDAFHPWKRYDCLPGGRRAHGKPR